MKNYLFITLSLLVLFFSSCSKEDDLYETSPVGTKVCVKRIISGVGIDTIVYDYNYDGTKLISWVRTVNSQVRTYTNVYTENLITGMVLDYGNGPLYYDFEYDTQGRVVKQYSNGNLYSTFVYTGLTVSQYYGHLSDSILIGEQTYNSDSNLILSKSKNSQDSSWVRVYEYTHDDKNMPFVNVDSWYPLSIYRYKGSNNTVNMIPVITDSRYVVDTDIFYDMDDFPTTKIETLSDGSIREETLVYNM